MEKLNNIYLKKITFENVYSTWNIVRKTCKNRHAIFRFYMNLNTNIYNLYDTLLHNSYKPLPFRLFLIFEPKPRLVMSQTVEDKIINHFVANYYLLPYLEKKLVECNVATRKGKGSKCAIKLLEDYINKIRIKEPGKEIYALNIDISKYFYNINHDILMQKLEHDILDKKVIDLIKLIIDETNKPYINETIVKLNALNHTDIPLYKYGTGLSIGAMTSQFLAIYYLNDVDHYIKEKLKCKYYIRYMDDFIILDTNREHLKEIWKLVEIELNKLKLKVNPKSNIIKMGIGFSFIGYKYKIENGKLKICYRKKTIKKIRKKLQNLKEHDLLRYYRTYGSYYGYLRKIKDVERVFKMKTVEKYEYYKKENLDKIVFVKEGSFYKTYKDDAIIMWDLFNYKWNHDSIAFGISNCSKVIDFLRNKGIGYVLVTEEKNVIKGDAKIYELYLELAKINFEKFEKKAKLYELVDRIISKDLAYVDELAKFLEECLESKVG